MNAINTPDRRLRVFISSTLRECADERAAARRAVERLRLTPVLFELGARPHPPRDLYLSYLRQSDVFVGVYGESYGWIAPGEDVSGLEDEYSAAEGKPKLIYLREPAPDRDPRLTALIERIRSDGLSYRSFEGPAELEVLVADDLAVLVSERFGAPEPVDLDAGGAESRPVPEAASRFVGRGEHLAELHRLIVEDDARLITLVGPGGIGKTRLALRAASDAASSFPDGVHVVMLSSVRDPVNVPTAIRTSLGLSESFGASSGEQVAEYFRGRRALLVLDNFEQVMDAAPTVADLLAAAPDLTVLVTSREVLRLTAERVYRVPPLAIPGPDASLGSLASFEGVELFIDRVRGIRGDLEMDDAQVRAAADIARRLDGLPLAIELAAAMARVLAPADILERLDDRLGALTGGPRDLPQRQRTLRLTMEWSYDLLTDAERDLFDRLAVFAGSFALDSVGAVWRDDDASGDDDAVEVLGGLIDRSLVNLGGSQGGGPRFTMLETIREFAQQRLAERDLLAAVRHAHATHFRDLVLRLEPGYEEGREIELIERLTADHENLRTALEWFIERGEPAEATRIAWAIWRFWWVRSLFREGIGYAERILAAQDGLSTDDRAAASYVLGHLAFGLSDYERAVPALENAKRDFDALGDDVGLALASITLAVIGGGVGAPGWEDDCRTALALAVDAANVWTLSYAELAFGSLLLTVDRPGEAAPLLARAVDHAAEIGTEVLRSYALVYLGRAQLALGELDSARAVLVDALDRAALMESLETISRILVPWSALELAEGHPERTAVVLGAAEAVRRSIATPVWQPDQPFHEDVERRCRMELGDERFDLHFGTGLDLSATEATAYARREEPVHSPAFQPSSTTA